MFPLVQRSLEFLQSIIIHFILQRSQPGKLENSVKSHISVLRMPTKDTQRPRVFFFTQKYKKSACYVKTAIELRNLHLCYILNLNSFGTKLRKLHVWGFIKSISENMTFMSQENDYAVSKN